MYKLIVNCSMSYDQNRKHLAAWEEKFVFCSADPNGSSKSYCKVCHSIIHPSLSSLRKHSRTQKHINASGQMSMEQATENMQRINTVPRAIKQAELSLAMHVGCHSTLRTADHVGEVIVKNNTGSGSMKNIKLHRTKCTALIKNVVAPTFRTSIKEDVEGCKFSLMFDGSSDISVHKNMN